jgi:hypothetical protein
MIVWNSMLNVALQVTLIILRSIACFWLIID